MKWAKSLQTELQPISVADGSLATKCGIPEITTALTLLLCIGGHLSSKCTKHMNSFCAQHVMWHTCAAQPAAALDDVVPYSVALGGPANSTPQVSLASAWILAVAQCTFACYPEECSSRVARLQRVGAPSMETLHASM
jgi:hypothetical protein